MAKECKKGVFTLYEVGEIAYKKYPGRFKNLASAQASVRTYAKECSVEDINGKKKYKQIAAIDVKRILERFEETNGKKTRKAEPGQANVWDYLPTPRKAEALGAPSKAEAPAIIREEIGKAAAKDLLDYVYELQEAGAKLAEAVKDFNNALANLRKAGA